MVMSPATISGAMMREEQTSDAVLMVRPVAFGFNPETAATNAFAAIADSGCRQLAMAEFDGAAERLAAAGVEIFVLDDSAEPLKPDAGFPNNWVSFHGDGTLVVYPMAAPTRRPERRIEELRALLEPHFAISEVLDLSHHEQSGCFLEGTGSLILDRPRRRALAALGPRTSRDAIAEFDSRLGYSTLTFDAADRSGRPIYHTNVMLSLGTHFAVLCLDVVSEEQRRGLIGEIEASGRTIIEVDYEQMLGFACNLLELRSRGGEPLIALSSAARASFRADQLRHLEGFGALVEADIPTIERVGGGSLRCMIADIHLPRL